MQPGALRALEFDRIVEAVTAFALTPMGGERLAGCSPRPSRRRSRSCWPQRPRRRATSRRTDRSRCAPRPICRRFSTRWPSRAGALEALRLLALAAFLDSVDETRTAIRRAPGSFPLLEAISGGAASFKGEIAQTRDKIDPSGDVVDHASPELKIDPRAAAQAADAAAEHARVVPARQGHGEVPAGSGRHRAERPLRPRRQGRASQRDSRHRARRVDERRQPVSRAAQHRRDQQRHRRARGAGARGSPAHPAGADRRVPRAARADMQRTIEAATELDVRAGARAVLRVDRRHRAGALDRRRVRAARRRGIRCSSAPFRSRSRSCRRPPSC